ncbi:hypothetical protein ACIBBE_05680 [Streptomyces sp. NPDC051644]|uniref:imine reductase family protein n=1 Tax=Streptomyces sp. NPDC051644 TaxID=3365666 RepID=UPI00379D6FB5
MNILPPIVAGTAADIDAKEYNGAGANLAMMTASVDHLLHASRGRGGAGHTPAGGDQGRL